MVKGVRYPILVKKEENLLCRVVGWWWWWSQPWTGPYLAGGQGGQLPPPEIPGFMSMRIIFRPRVTD